MALSLGASGRGARRLVWLVAAITLIGPVLAPAQSGPDQSDPAAVVQELFAAARSMDFSKLGGLCDPQGEGDGDTRRICQLATSAAGRDEFVAAFRDGRLDGAAQLQGDRAQVPFRFGPNGSRGETMSLVRRGDRWYLLSF